MLFIAILPPRLGGGRGEFSSIGLNPVVGEFGTSFDSTIPQATIFGGTEGELRHSLGMVAAPPPYHRQCLVSSLYNRPERKCVVCIRGKEHPR